MITSLICSPPPPPTRELEVVAVLEAVWALAELGLPEEMRGRH